MFQRGAFRNRARRHDRLDQATRNLGPILFLSSVFAVLIHFGIDLFRAKDGLHAVSTLLIVLAATLPVIGAGICTLRAAYEFGRNTSRYRA